MSTTVSILLTSGYILWRLWADRAAARERASTKARQDAQEQIIKGIQDAIAQCPFVTYPTPYNNDVQRTG